MWQDRDEKPKAKAGQIARIVLLGGAVIAGCAATVVQSSVSGLCYRAAAAAAAETGVPIDVLVALTWTETGRAIDSEIQPWPWALNDGGTSHWLPDQYTATDYVQRLIADGRTNFDVGCFQINYRWHGTNFPSIEAMFDPNQNALYAARFIQTLQEESGDWSTAAGAYHSRTPSFATRYREVFDRHLSTVTSAADPTWARNLVPFLESNGPILFGNPISGSRTGPVLLGSLVPVLLAQ